MSTVARISKKDLELGKLLGRGSFGKVYKAYWCNRGQWKRVAVKLVKLDMISCEDVCNEAKVMVRLEHPRSRVISCYGVAKYSDVTAIVMQYMAKGTFNGLIL